jgi:hypothetical protein
VLTTCLVVVAGLGVSAAAAEAATIVTTSPTVTGGSPGGTQTGRLVQDSVPSQCDSMVLKLAPSLQNPGSSFIYLPHTFRNLLNHPVCITVDIDNSTCPSLFSVAYLPSFVPGDPLANYAADMGSAASSPVYSFYAPAGSPIAVVVHSTSTSPPCGNYTITLSSRGPWPGNFGPRISGAPALGSVLTGTDATWAPTPAPTVQRRWVRCDPDGANCADIPGATGATYTVGVQDLGRSLRFRNAATDAQATNTSDSNFVEPYIPFESHPSESLGAGDRVQNGVFVRDNVETRCSAPNAAPAILQPMATFLYDTFPVRSLLNESVCLVTRAAPVCAGGVSPAIYNPVFVPGSGLAANYAANAGGDFGLPGTAAAPLPAGGSREVTVSRGGSGGACAAYGVTLGADAPFATARPALSGTAATGSVLSASNGSWSGTPAFARSWRRCDTAGAACVPIPGATGATYTPTNADIGKRLRARVAATRGRTVSSDSLPSAIVLDRTGPVGALRLGSRNLRKAIRSGRIPVRVGCDEACSAVVELRVTRKLAKRLKLKRKVVIARSNGNLAAGQRKTLRAKLTKRARRALRTRRSVRFSMRARFDDTAGNRSRKARGASMKLPKKKQRR